MTTYNISDGSISGLDAWVGDGVTDNYPKYLQVRSWAAGITQPPYLDIVVSPGTYYCSNYPSFIDPGNTTPGIQLANISASGVTFDQLVVGTQGLWETNDRNVRVKTVNAGATTIELVNPSDPNFSKFSSGDWVVLTGVDCQGSDYPLNPFFFEYLQIQSISSPFITFNSALKHSYKDTWPNYSTGQPYYLDEGGPGTLYLLDRTWPCDITWNGMTVLTNYQTYGRGRRIVCNNCTMDGKGFVPTQNQTVEINGGINGTIETEYDKMVDNLYASNVTMFQPKFQSASVNNVVFTSCAITASFNGTPKSLTLNNCSVGGNITLGPLGYGHAEKLVINGGSIDGTVGYPIKNQDMSEVTYLGGGILRVTKAFGASHQPSYMAVPGAWGFIGDNWTSYLPLFKVLDVTCDETYVYIHTTMTYESLPTFDLDVVENPTKFGVLNCLRVTVRNCACANADVDALNRARSGRPFGEYNDRHWTTSWSGLGVQIEANGKLKKITVDVRKTYDGLKDAWFYVDTSNNIRWIDLDGGSPYTNTHLTSPIIDVRHTGIRTFTAADGATPGLNEGSVGNDALGTPFGNLYVRGGIVPGLSVSTADEADGVQPEIFFSIETDTGFVDDEVPNVNYLVLRL